jgi:hypothetical protein
LKFGRRGKAPPALVLPRQMRGDNQKSAKNYLRNER